jgi:hypothetical protein
MDGIVDFSLFEIKLYLNAAQMKVKRITNEEPNLKRRPLCTGPY